MRDYLIITIVLASLPIGLFRPFYGLLVYTWISLMYPQEYAYSAKTFPVAMLSGVSLVAGTLINGAITFRPLSKLPNISLLFLWLTFTASSLFAIYPVLAWNKWQDMAKILLIGIITSMLLTDEKRTKQFVLVVALSLGIYGLKGGLFSLFTGGENMIWGPGNSILGGNNNIGLALNMLLPIAWYAAAEHSGWLKRLLQLTFLCTIPAIMFTYSRASALTLPVVVLAIVLKSKHRTAIIVGATAAVILAVPYVPDRFWDRQATVLTYEEDASSMSRIDNWKFCWKVVMDRPFTGAGFDFQTRETFAQYAPEFLVKYGGKVWDTHSIYFQMLASHGIPGFIAFMLMIGGSMFCCRRMERAVRRRPDLKWIGNYASMTKISLFALLLNGAFVNMEYFELVYQLVGLTAALQILFAREMSRTENNSRDSSFWLAQPQPVSR